MDDSLFALVSMIKTAALIASPILAVSLVVGVLISIIQVVTQIQELTLTFIPKLVAATVVIIFLGHWMISTWRIFAINLITSIGHI